MNQPPTDPDLAPAAHPRAAYGYALGALAGLSSAALYALAAEVLSITFGLIAVGFFGGWAIGGAVNYGAWSGHAHGRVRALEVGAAVIAAGAWLVALLLSYVVSQVLLPAAATSLLERLTLSGLAAYLGGTFDSLWPIHIGSLVSWTLVAWRQAR